MVPFRVRPTFLWLTITAKQIMSGKVEVNPVKLQLLEMRSDTARVSHCLQHYSVLRKTPGTRPGGKTMAGLKHIKGKDYDRIAIRLLDTEWTGKLVTNSLMRMADEIEAGLALTHFFMRQAM